MYLVPIDVNSDINFDINLVKKIQKIEVFETDNVESKWNATKWVWQKATEQVCWWTKGSPRDSETWWWNDEVANAIEEKKDAIRS